MERQDITELIAIDVSVAFHIVDHNISIEVLHRKCGAAETALECFASYLRPQFCRINVNDFYSINKQLECNVQQGSVAGTMLYKVCASMIESVLEAGNQTEDTLPSNLRKRPYLHGFADDCAMKSIFKGSNRQAETLAVSNLKLSASNIKGWMDCNILKLNDGKTEFIIYIDQKKVLIFSK